MALHFLLAVWSDTNPGGAYAFTANTPGALLDSGCAPIPDGYGVDASLYPIALSEHGPPIEACLLACNVTTISTTDVDPCNSGFVGNAGNLTYSCFSGGASWLGDSSLGVCGFPCLAFDEDGGLCTESSSSQGKCLVYCDPRFYPSQSLK